MLLVFSILMKVSCRIFIAPAQFANMQIWGQFFSGHSVYVSV